MRTKNQPSNPNRFVAQADDIEVIKGPLRITGGPEAALIPVAIDALSQDEAGGAQSVG
jgi:hypothetical protein